MTYTVIHFELWHQNYPMSCGTTNSPWVNSWKQDSQSRRSQVCSKVCITAITRTTTRSCRYPETAISNYICQVNGCTVITFVSACVTMCLSVLFGLCSTAHSSLQQCVSFPQRISHLPPPIHLPPITQSSTFYLYYLLCFSCHQLIILDSVDWRATLYTRPLVSPCHSSRIILLS